MVVVDAATASVVVKDLRLKDEVKDKDLIDVQG